VRGGTLLFVIVAILMVTVVLRDSRPAGVPTTRAPRAIATTNRYRRFEADDVDDVVWPVGDIRELVVVPEGLFIRAEGRSTPCGVGVGPEWVALLPLLGGVGLHPPRRRLPGLDPRAREPAGARSPGVLSHLRSSGDRPFGWFRDGLSAYASRRRPRAGRLLPHDRSVAGQTGRPAR